MQFRLTVPAIPRDLLDRYGEPEDAFGPNMRFRVASLLLGMFLCLLGTGYVILGVLGKIAQAQPGGAEGILLLQGCGLLAVGGAAVFLPRSVPQSWLFVCPGGLVRARGAGWDAVSWAEVARFQDTSLSTKSATIRQCRIITAVLMSLCIFGEAARVNPWAYLIDVLTQLAAKPADMTNLLPDVWAKQHRLADH